MHLKDPPRPHHPPLRVRLYTSTAPWDFLCVLTLPLSVVTHKTNETDRRPTEKIYIFQKLVDRKLPEVARVALLKPLKTEGRVVVAPLGCQARVALLEALKTEGRVVVALLGCQARVALLKPLNTEGRVVVAPLECQALALCVPALRQ